MKKYKITVLSNSFFVTDWELVTDNYFIKTTNEAHFIYDDNEGKNLKQIVPLNRLILINIVDVKNSRNPLKFNNK